VEVMGLEPTTSTLRTSSARFSDQDVRANTQVSGTKYTS
jgi:hypothetical protein